jgi:hypothetical protein
MRNPDKLPLRAAGATLATLAALGGASAKAAFAESFKQPAHPAKHHVETVKPRVPKAVPDGVEMAPTSQAIQQEAQDTVNHLTKVWNGVLVLHEPKEFASVGFTESPTAYGDPISSSLSVRPGSDNVAVVIKPGIEKRKNGRTYAVIFDKVTNRWGSLDIEWAKETGALDSYAFKDSAAKPMPYNVSALPMDVITTETATPAQIANIHSVQINGGEEVRQIVPGPVPHV